MLLKRIATAVRMTAREFLRRRGMLALMVVSPVMTFAMVRLALPDAAATVDAVENGMSVQVDTGQVALFGGVSALMYAAMLAGIMGFYIMFSAMKTDRRLLLAGYHAFELVTARCVVLLLMAAGTTVLLVAIMLFFFTPMQFGAYVLAIYQAATIYAFYGGLAATMVRSELGGLIAIVFFASIDVRFLEMPGYSNVIGEWWTQFLPGYFPVQLALDAAFTSHPDLLVPSLWTGPHALAVAGVMLGTYSRATRVHPFLSEHKRGLPWAPIVLTLLLAVGAAGGWRYYQEWQARPPAVDAEGRVNAPKAQVVVLASGRLRSLEVAEGDDVEEDQIVAWMEDSLTGASLAMRAPVRGRVTTMAVRRGENVAQGTVLAEIHRLHRLGAVLEVDEAHIDEVAIGQAVDLTLPSLGIHVQTRVAEIASIPLPPDASVSERTRRIRKYAVKCPIEGQEGKLRLGVAVKGRIFPGGG